ncbi:hypothetical protein BT63DRAFT_20799 [Microthyrium microscopicum]|uniref:Checkpoint protein RAD24-like helical bundle domain-containing protein n=1 Tax=Microthyrium microscopicum TaxID=703497 RepID=A0A6A6USR5_9PEZI|nr:hypothetical protein BT63DRAFT_20799 [Microthyrium microscopicum]
MARRKRAVVESDEENKGPSSPETPKGSIQAAFARAALNKSGTTGAESPTKSTKASLPVRRAVPTRKAKPPQPRSNTNSPASKNKTIHSFFNNATQRQSLKRSVSPDKGSVQGIDLEDDLIVDSSDEDGNVSSFAYSIASVKRRKITPVNGDSNGRPPASQKFLPSQAGSNGPGSQPFGAPQAIAKQEKRPWTEQYGPVDLDEVAVHKRKVQDVRDWLTRTISGKGRERLLILKGGAGTGKTTTIKLLAQKLGLKLTEWRNPDSTDPGMSLASQFEEFVGRTSLFGSLELFGPGQVKIAETTHGGHAILVEEFPNTYSQSSSAVQGFRKAVLHFLAAATPSTDDFFAQKSNQAPVVPVIMIISESLLTTSTAAADSFTAHRLLGSEIINHVGTTLIEFNRIAPTFMSKALDLILKKEARRSGRRFAPGQAVLQHISEAGDIRSAVSALEFFCLHKGGEADWSGKIQFTKGKKGAAAGELTSMEKQSLEMITQRENTLGIFHAVGKVVYNKRELPPATDTPPPQPPPWLPQYQRPKASEIDVEGLLNELGTDIHIFILALHENYALSCSGLTDEDTLDTVNGCLDSLSDSDLLCPDRFATNQSRYTFQGTTTDALRQDEISFNASVRGILFNLPHPVKRSTPPPEYVAGRGKTGRGTSAFQMLYPTSLRLWRKKEQIEELVDLFNDKYRNGLFEDELRARNRSKQALGSVTTWQKNSKFPGALGSQTAASTSETETSLVARGATKGELLLERLPYVHFIEKRRATASKTSLLKQLEKVVSFGGITAIMANDEEEEEVDTAGQSTEQWSTDKPVDGSPVKRKNVGILAKGSESVQKEIEGLVLSDDDIVDDE